MPDNKIKSLDGLEFGAYVAAPPNATGPGLIVIQEIFGVNDDMRYVCNFVAQKGYLAVCPDLFWRRGNNINFSEKSADGWQRAFELYKSFDIEAGVRDLLATVAHIRKMPACNGKVGALGFGLGGKLAYLMAARSDIDCAAGYYAVGMETVMDEFSDIRVPFLLHLAEQDKLVPRATQDRIVVAAKHNPAVKIETHAAEHAFAGPGGSAYNAPVAKRAHEITVSFLDQYLKI
ncbi:MAG: dienelactone hydrolase family protein [Alphaproteobacteria bacterium]|nr:dienelactone hydrolase family protein [Alphaproteobacteria bacterium]